MRSIRRWLLACLAVACMGTWSQEGSGQFVPMRVTAGEWVTEYYAQSGWYPGPTTAGYSTREAACAALPEVLDRQGINKGLYCGAQLFSASCCGVWVVGWSKPGACDGGYLCGRTGGFLVESRTVWRPPGSTCPANATPADPQRCQCQPGYWADNGACVQIPSPPLGCAAGAGAFAACPGNTPWSAATPAPAGTPADGGLHPDAGEPGGPSEAILASATGTVGSSSSCRAVEAAGNPIFTGTGNKYQREVDYADARGLSLVRHYNSSLPGWVHNFAVRVLADGTNARVLRPDGRAIAFRGQGWGAWQAEPGFADRLERLDPAEPGQAMWKFTAHADDTREWYDAQGRLLRIARRDGISLVALHDASGLAAVSDPAGRSLRFEHDAHGRIVQVMAPDSQAIRYGYDAQGRLAVVTYADGTTRQYLYEDASWPLALTGLVDERGIRLASWAYDGRGRAVMGQRAGGVDRFELAFGADGVQVMDPMGTRRLQRYATTGARRLFAGQDSPCLHCRGDAAVRSLDAGTGLVDSEADYLGVSTVYTWDPARRLPLSITRAAGRAEARSTATQWHAQFALPMRVTEAGRTTDTTYDESGNRLTETVTDTATGAARAWAWTHDSQGLVATATDPRGSTWRFVHDAVGNRVRSIDPLGHETQFTHDGAGRILSRRDANGGVTRYTYDPRGRVLSITRTGAGLSEATVLTYTPTGQVASALLPSGHQLQYDYDAAQRLVGARDNRGARVRWELDAMGQRVREEWQDASGRIARSTAQVIDALGRVVAVQDAGGHATRLDYDANGEVVSRTDPLGQATRLTLDGLRRPTGTTFPDNASAAQAWNARDQLTQVTDPKGVRTSYETNAFGEVVAETSPDIGTRRYTRGAGGDVAQVEDAKGQVTRYERDALGRPTRITHADGAQAVLAYDAMGHLTGHEDASGSTRYERDLLGRVLTKTQAVNDDPGSPSRFQVSYEWQGGELAGITYPSGLKLVYRREAGHITGIDVQRPGKRQALQPWITALTHTALGQPQAWRWASGDSATRQFNADGRLVATEFARYGYDAAGRMTGVAQDLWARTVRTDGSTALTTATLTWQAGYDVRDRLVRFTRTGQDTRYTYDANGNRLAAVRQVTRDSDLDGVFEDSDLQEAISQALQVDAGSNRLLGFAQTVLRTNQGKAGKPVTTQVAYAVDANGSLTHDGHREFVHDASGRLARVVLAQDAQAASIRYLHNTLGQRVFKSEIEAQVTEPEAATLGEAFVEWLRKLFGWLFSRAQATTSIGTAYVYGDGPIPEWALLGEYDNGSASGRGRTEYLWLPTEDGGAIPVGLYRGGKLLAIHPDHLGTPRLITNEDNEPVWQWPYSAFGDNPPTGALKATPNPRTALTHQPQLLRATTPIEFNLRMPGQYHDAETGLAYNGWRSYCPACGRYVQADPVGLEGGINRFDYVGASPLMDIDPEGLTRRAGHIGPSMFPPIGRPSPRTPVGTVRSPLEVRPGTNSPGEIAGLYYSGHALDRMQGRGIPPSAVANAVLSGQRSAGSLPNTTQYHDPVNNVTVVTNSTTGNIITVRNGVPSQACR